MRKSQAVTLGLVATGLTLWAVQCQQSNGSAGGSSGGTFGYFPMFFGRSTSGGNVQTAPGSNVTRGGFGGTGRGFFSGLS